MEQYFDKAVDLISSADIYLLALAGVLAALMPIIRKTKTKTDDKIAEKISSILEKIRGFLNKNKDKKK